MCEITLVFKVPHPGNHHRQSFLFAEFNAVLIADGSTGLDKSW